MSELLAAIEQALFSELPKSAGALQLSSAGFSAEEGGVSVRLQVSGAHQDSFGFFIEDTLDPQRVGAALTGFCQALGTVLEAMPAEGLSGGQAREAVRSFRAAMKKKKLVLAEHYREFFLGPKELGRLMPLDPAWLAAVSETIDQVFREAGPVASANGLVSLDPVPRGPEEPLRYAQEQAGYGLCVVFRLIVWDEQDGQRAIRDVKEQDVALLRPGTRPSPERLRGFLLAWAELLPQLFAREGVEVDTLMPHDLVPTEALGLARPQTKEDFLSVLRRKWRLG